MTNAHALAPAGGSEKRSSLHSGALTDEALTSSEAVLHPSGYRGPHKGLQQFFSPPEAATLAAAVMGGHGAHAPYVLDPTAGSGALIAQWRRERRFGLEIDPDHVQAADYTAVRGDVQRVYPLLRIAGVRFGAVCCNPPFGLTWTDPSGERKANSTVLCLRYALGLLEHNGQGLLISGRDRFWREVAPAPEGRGVYCTVECEDLFDDVDLPCVLAFFVQPSNRTEAKLERLRAPRVQLGELVSEVRRAQAAGADHVRRYAFDYDPGTPLREAFACVQREHDRRVAAERGQRPRHDLALRGDRIACRPSAFAKLALSERGLLRQVQDLDGKACSYFALNLREWRAVEQAAIAGALSIAPDVRDRVEQAVAKAKRDATPLYAVKRQMRLGFLTDLERIHCVKDDPERGFLFGEDYSLTTRSRVHVERGQKLMETRRGEAELRRYEKERKLLEITIGSQRFDESPESIAYVIEHFDLPDPGDLADRYPAEVNDAKDLLHRIAAEHGFTLRRFQLEDLARLLVKESGLLLWEQGGGKTLGQLCLAEACVRRGAQNAVLFVVPQDLIPQWQREARKFLGRELEEMSNPVRARAVARHLRRGGEGWYITYYEALSLSGRKDEPLPEQVIRYGRPNERGERLPLLTSAEACPICHADVGAGWKRGACRRCGHVHKRLKLRSAASYLSAAFRCGVVCVDELSLIRGDDSLRSKAIRALRARHRFGATGTPITNYVNDAYWGLWWTLGNASERFPYDYNGKAKFERDFCVIEYLMGGEGEEHLRKRRKVLPEVTNLSLLWRLLSASMARRRKEDMGEELATRTFYPTTVPFGQRQLALHKKWLQDFTRYFEQTHPSSPLVQAGVVEQFAAGLGQLPKLEYAATLPECDPDLAWTGLEASNWTPKNLKVLEICLERVRAGDKVLIGSCLVETGRFLAARLCERGVHAIHIVEDRQGRAQTKAPRRRAAEVQAFVEGDAQVLCAGVNAVKLGHNLDTASTVILDGLPWSHEALDQFLARVHRLTSRRPVSVYVVLTRGSIDERKWDLLIKKGQAADLALDGQLIVEPEQPIDWSKVLRDMRAAGVKATDHELDEDDLHRLWQRAQAPYAPIALAISLAARIAAEQPRDPVIDATEDDGGQLSFGLAA